MNPRNHYLMSLLDPENVTGAKIPDLVAYPSGTFQLVVDGLLTTASGGDSIAIVAYPFIGDNSTFWPVTTSNGTTSGSLASQANVNWSNRSSVPGVWTQNRPVSMALRVEFIGPSTADGGYCCFGLAPRSQFITAPTTFAFPNTFSSYLSINNSTTSPVRNGAIVRWRPQDNLDLEYNEPVTRPDSDSQDYPALYFAATAMPSSISYIKYRVTANFEGIAQNSLFSMVQAEASPVNMPQLEEGFNVMANSPSGGPLTDYASLGLAGVGAAAAGYYAHQYKSVGKVDYTSSPQGFNSNKFGLDPFFGVD